MTLPYDLCEKSAERFGLMSHIEAVLLVKLLIVLSLILSHAYFVICFSSHINHER